MGKRLGATWVATLGACVALLGVAAPSHAEPSGAERAAAESLFQSATSAMNAGNFAAACEKFEGSLQLDAALGTMMRLGDCYDRVGKSASAWAMFHDAESLAHTRDEAAREQMATERIADLEKRLSLVRITFAFTPPPDLVLRVDGAVIPRASFNGSLPLDPGARRIEVTAPERRTWSTTLQVAAGPALQTLSVPELAKELRPASASKLQADTSLQVAPANHGTQRGLAYAAGAVGLVGLGVGGFLVYRARSVNDGSLEHCRPDDPNACSQQGVSERNDARKLATGATAALVGGGALLTTGVLLLLLTPSDERPGRDTATNLNAWLGTAGGGLSYSNRW